MGEDEWLLWEAGVWVRCLVVNVTVEAEVWSDLSMREAMKAVHTEEEEEEENKGT